MGLPGLSELKVIGTQGDDAWLLVMKDYDVSDRDTIAWVVREESILEYWLESIVQKGYWEPVTVDVATVMGNAQRELHDGVSETPGIERLGPGRVSRSGAKRPA